MDKLNFTLLRLKSTRQEGVFGILINEDTLKTYAIGELNWQDNKSNISCIPEGVYDLLFTYSPKYEKNLYRIVDSQSYPRSAILIHSGNYVGMRSMGLKSNSDGCLIIGEAYSDNLGGQAAVINSVKALNQFHRDTKGNPISLRIIDGKR